MKKIFSPLILITILILTLGTFQTTLSYSTENTHPDLAKEAINFYIQKFPNKNITQKHIEAIRKGAIDEDLEPRYINHFYDPQTGEGWTGDDLKEELQKNETAQSGLKNTEGELIKKVVLNITSFGQSPLASPRWAQSSKDQNSFLLYGGDKSWQKAIYDYAQGKETEALEALGHTMHLIEDASVPDHTRNDSHVIGSPYENWVKNYTNKIKLQIADELVKNNAQIPYFENLNQAFDYLAKYSNENFFSEDTIGNEKYFKPLITKLIKIDENTSKFVGIINNQTIDLALKIRYSKNGKIYYRYTVNDPEILAGYFSRLSQKSVITDAGVIDLFFREVEKVKNNASNLEKPVELNALDIAKNIVISPLGEIMRIERALETTKSFFASVINSISNITSSALNSIKNLGASIISPLINNSSPTVQNENNDLVQNNNEIILPPADPDNELTIDSPTENIPINDNALPTNDAKKTEAPQSIQPIPVAPTSQPQQPAQNPNQQAPMISAPNFIMVLRGPDIINADDNNNNPIDTEENNDNSPTENNPSEENTPPEEETPLPAEDEETPPVEDNEVPPAEEETTPPAEEETTPPAEEETTPPAEEETPPTEEETPPQEPEDITPPNPISDFLAATGDNRGEIILNWTAPADPVSADEIAVNNYEIRHSLSLMDENNWADAEIVANPPIPASPNSNESLTVLISNLTASHPNDLSDTHYFAIKSYDLSENTSDISNIASAKAYALANYPVISEIKTQGLTANDEFIELYNPTEEDINISEWSIQYRGSKSENFYKKNFENDSIIPAYGFFLISHNDYKGNIMPDMKHSSFSISATGGTIFLVSNQILLIDPADESIIDKISYGDGTYLFPEAEVFATAPSNIQSLERKSADDSQTESGNELDQNNNSQDFILQNSANPQNTLSPIEPRDSNPTLANSDWPTAYQNYQFTNQALGIGPNQTPTQISKFKLAYSGDHQPPIIGPNNIIYVADRKYLHAIDATSMTELWTFDSTGSLYGINTSSNEDIQSAPVIDSDGNIYFSKMWHILSVSKSGKLRWYYNFTGQLASPVIIDNDGTIYFNAYNPCCFNKLTALNPNGALKWQLDLPTPYNGKYSTPILIGDKIYSLSNRSNNSGAGTKTGICEINKQGELISDSVFDGFFGSLQAVYGNSIIYSIGAKLYKYDTNNNAVSEFTNLSSGYNFLKISIDKNTGNIYSPANSYTSGSLNIIGQDGSINTPAVYGYYIYSSLIDTNSNAYYSLATSTTWTNNTIKIKAVSPSGEQLWELNLPEETDYITSLVMDGQGNIFGISNTGYLYKFSP